MEEEIKAEEREKIEEVDNKTWLGNLMNRYHYPTKKMEVMMGKYNIDKYVVLNQKVLTKALVYMSLVIKENDGAEIMGMIVGKKENGKIILEDAWIGDCMSTSGSTEISWEERIKLQKRARKEGVQILGWWHSHPSFSSSPSPVDTRTNLAWEQSIEEPMMLIVSPHEFTLCTTKKGFVKKVDFIIPPSMDNKIDLNLAYLNKKPSETDEHIIYEQFGQTDSLFFDNWILCFCEFIGDELFTFGRNIKSLFTSKSTRNVGDKIAR